MRKGNFFALIVISMFLVSACDIYNTLYVKQPSAQVAVEIPDINATLGIPADMNIEQGIDAEKSEKSQAANVIIVEETEKVSLAPKAEDPDNDALIFAFTSPLDSNGEWQTAYGDEGEYTATVTASDGSLTTSKDVLIIVKKKEEAPVFDRFEPVDSAVEVKETEAVNFEVSASDLNNDELSYEWKLDGVSVGDMSSYSYQTTYEDSGSHTAKVKVSDGAFDTEKIWAVTVNNVNRKPVLENVGDIQAKEADKVIIELKAGDPDGEEISYSISDERFSQEGNLFTWETDYDDAGEYAFTVSASDGVDTASQEVRVAVQNINRAPVILDIVQK